jgi:hypothetical protein
MKRELRICWAMNIIRRPGMAVSTFLFATCVLFGAAASVYAQQLEMTEEQFDQFVYNGNGNKLSNEDEISVAVDAIDRICHLSAAQQDKLQLAARGDFVRFQQRVDELRTEYVGKSYDQNDLSKIIEKIQPLSTTYRAGLLGPSSLFVKVIRRTLTAEQLEEYDAAEAERLKQRYSDKVRLLVAVFEETCPLKDNQRSALVELLLTETKPPKRPSQYDWYVVLAQASKIPEQKFSAILDPAQMRVLKKSLERGRSIAAFLKQQDILPGP